MMKDFIFGIWEFIFAVIIVSIAFLVVKPAIINYIDENNQRSFDKTVDEIIAEASGYVRQNETLFSEDFKSYKITLQQLADNKLIKLPIKNAMTGFKLDSDKVYVIVKKEDGNYQYKLVIKAKYSEAKKLSSQKVKVGDYVSYPIEYIEATDIGVIPKTLTGWRILTIEGDTIRVVSAAPTINYNIDEVGQGYKDLTNGKNYTCFTQETAVTSLNPCFGNYVDLKYVTNNVTTISNETIAKIALSSDLRVTGSMYWIINDTNKVVRYVDYEGNLANYSVMAIGIRPVLTLRKDIRTTGKVNGEWQLITK